MNCNQENLVTLCRSHNSIVNSKRKFWETKITADLKKRGEFNEYPDRATLSEAKG